MTMTISQNRRGTKISIIVKIQRGRIQRLNTAAQFFNRKLNQIGVQLRRQYRALRLVVFTIYQPVYDLVLRPQVPRLRLRLSFLSLFLIKSKINSQCRLHFAGLFFALQKPQALLKHEKLVAALVCSRKQYSCAIPIPLEHVGTQQSMSFGTRPIPLRPPTSSLQTH
ncbi:hypothetical protein Droror1_Dr00021236 [Drosera rotundifolia]